MPTNCTPVKSGVSSGNNAKELLCKVLLCLTILRPTKVPRNADATGSQPLAVLTLSNAATGQVIGTMTNLGKGKFTFQGSVSPVTTLRLDSNYSGSSSLGVAQK